MADSEDTAAKANDAAHAAAGTVTQAARSARSSARRTGSRARSRARSAALEVEADSLEDQVAQLQTDLKSITSTLQRMGTTATNEIKSGARARAGDLAARGQSALDTARTHAGDALTRGSECVRERPATSLLTAFALGVAVGAIVAAATRSEPKPVVSLDDSRTRLAEILGTVAANLRGPLSKTYASMSDSASSLSDSVTRTLEKIHPPKKFGWW